MSVYFKFYFRLVKSMPRFGGQAKTPTVINPDLYKLRFIEAMNRYFAVVQ